MGMNIATKLTVQLSIFFFLLFTAFSSFMTILTYIYEQQNLTSIGPTTLASIYLSFICSSLIAPGCHWRFKWQMVGGGIMHTLCFASGLIVPFVQNQTGKIAIAAICGIIAGSSGGFLWVSMGGYLQLVCLQNDIVQQKGKYFGIFTGIYCISNVSAGVVSTFGIGFFSPFVYFLMIIGVGGVSVLVCLTLQDIQDPSYHLYQPLPPPPKYDLVASLKQIIKFFPRMVSVMPILLINGICMGIAYGQLQHLLPSNIAQQNKDLYVGLMGMAMGVGSAIGGYVSGVISDHYNSKISSSVILVLFLTTCTMSLIILHVNSYFMSFFTAFLWGLANFYLEGWMFTACSRYFNGKLEAFSVNKIMHSITYFLFQIMVLATNNELNLNVLFIASMGVVVPAFIFLRYLPKEESRKKHDDYEDDKKNSLNQDDN